MKHLETNNILSDHHFGHSHSCETLLITLLHDLSCCYDTGIQTDIIFTDFAKAFDTVPHQHLLYKLDIKGGFRGVLGALKHHPPKFYNEQARKLLEAVVQVQLHFIHMYGQLKDGKSKGNS